MPTSPDMVPPHHDQAALRAAMTSGAALCTVVRIEGSFSRRLGAQLAVGNGKVLAGSLADGCLENQLVSEADRARDLGRPILVRFGAGSANIDFRLPCGSGLDILIDPDPDREAIARTIAALDARQTASLALPMPDEAPAEMIRARPFIPGLRLCIFGEGPEMSALAEIAVSAGALVETFGKMGSTGGTLSLGRAPANVAADPWTAVVLLFHDHEWEGAILHWALDTDAFYIGAQGGRAARENRRKMLLADGCSESGVDRIRSPIGLIGHARDPAVLALSVLAEIVADYEALYR